MASGAAPSYSVQSKRLVQLVAGLGSSVASFLIGAMFVAAPTIGRDLGGDVALLAWLSGAFFLTAASLLIPFGRIADVRGSKRVFKAGMAVYVVSASICMVAPNMLILVLGRALTGVGAAMVLGTAIALLSLVFPDVERGKAVGVNVTAMFASLTAGLLIAGLLTHYVSWRALFAIAAVIALANLFLLHFRVTGECELARERNYDPVGMVLFSLGFLLLFFGLSEILVALGQVCLVAGIVLLIALMAWERRARHPLINRALSNDRSFLLALVTNVAFQAGWFAVPFLLSLYAQLSLNLDSREVGLILVVPQIIMTIMGSVAGRALTKVGNRSITLAGATVNIVGLSVLLFAADTSLLSIIASLALIGIGVGMFMPAIINWAMDTIARREYGVASAMTEASRLLGMTLSNVILILAFSFLAVGDPGGQSPTAAVRLASLIFMLLTVSVAVLSIISRRKSSQRPQPSRAE